MSSTILHQFDPDSTPLLLATDAAAFDAADGDHSGTLSQAEMAAAGAAAEQAALPQLINIMDLSCNQMVTAMKVRRLRALPASAFPASAFPASASCLLLAGAASSVFFYSLPELASLLVLVVVAPH